MTAAFLVRLTAMQLLLQIKRGVNHINFPLVMIKVYLLPCSDQSELFDVCPASTELTKRPLVAVAYHAWGEAGGSKEPWLAGAVGCRLSLWAAALRHGHWTRRAVGHRIAQPRAHLLDLINCYQSKQRYHNGTNAQYISFVVHKRSSQFCATVTVLFRNTDKK